MPKTRDWQGKSAIVCGASSGLGRELSWQLAAGGAGHVVVVARSRDRLQQLVEELRASYPKTVVVPLAADTTDPVQMQRVVDQLRKLPLALDLAVNAVGQSDRGTIEHLTCERLDELCKANLVSSLNMVQAVRPAFPENSGCIVLIGSLASLFAPRFLGGYAIAKHALAALAQQSRLELASDGIHVMLACPGPIARADSGTRYESRNSQDIPAEALQPGGGARLKGLDAPQLARDILRAAASGKRTLIRPRRAQLLWIVSALSPRLGDYFLQRETR